MHLLATRAAHHGSLKVRRIGGCPPIPDENLFASGGPVVVTAEAPSPVPATAGLHGWRAALCRAWLHRVLLKASLRLGVGKIAALPSPSDACTTRLLPGQDHLRSLPDYIDGRRHGRQCELDGQWCQNAENMQDFHNLSHMGAALGLPSEFQAWDVWHAMLRVETRWTCLRSCFRT